MKKISFGLLIIGLALPMLSLAQSTMGISGSAVEPQKAEMPGKSVQSSASDIYKLISPMVPAIAPMINKVIPTESKPGSAGSSSNPDENSFSGGGSSASGDSVKISPTGKLIMPGISASAFPACYIGDDLMKQYDSLISDLQDAQKANNTENINSITQKIIELKKQISASKTNCGVGSGAATNVTASTTKVRGTEEPLKAAEIQSVKKIQDYYKASIENITGAQNASDTLKQVKQLNELKDIKDQMVGDLIKNNKEVQASDINLVAKEIDISKNGIKIDNTAVETIGSKIMVNVGSSSISVESMGNNVIINDKNLKVTTDNVSISSSSLKIGGVEVKLAASDVAEKLNIAPSAVQLTTENSQPVYKMQVPEQRKLFGFIKINAQNTQTADANSGNLISQSKPWYYFLTTQ